MYVYNKEVVSQNLVSLNPPRYSLAQVGTKKILDLPLSFLFKTEKRSSRTFVYWLEYMDMVLIRK